MPITGTAGDDIITNTQPNNTVSALGGNDAISDSGPGSTIDGGAGIDLVALDRSFVTTPVRLSFDAQGTSSQPPDFTDGTVVTNAESIWVVTGSGADSVVFSNPVGNMVWACDAWDGGAGVDSATVNMTNDTAGIATSIVNGAFVVTSMTANGRLPALTLLNVEKIFLYGGSGPDVFQSYDSPPGGLTVGWVLVDGRTGNDTIYGSASIRASYQSAASGVTVNLGSNAPQYIGPGEDTDTLINVSNVIGSKYGDVITGSSRDDSIWSDDGNDHVDGGAGNDGIFAGNGDDMVSGGAGADDLHGDAGNDTLLGEDDGDTLTGGAGNDLLDGGANVDTAVFAGNKAAYVLSQTSPGTWQVSGPDGTDMLANIEYAKFDDQTMRLLPGSGTTVDFAAYPATYMAAIRDFDGNDLGAFTSWKLIGTADVNGDGRAEHVLFNRQIGRWAEVGTEADGLTYFNNYSWAGDTRVVGIYIDPLVANGTVVKGSDTDSQRRFQNDLQIDNIHGILGQNDYNHDGLQEVYFSLTDGTAYLHAYMHADGNIQYANYQNKQQVIDYLTTNGWSSGTWSGWFPSSQAPLVAGAGG